MATTITAVGTQVVGTGTGGSVNINVPAGAVTDDIVLVCGVHQGNASWTLDANLTTIFSNSETGGLHVEMFAATYRVPASSPATSFTCTRSGTTAKGYLIASRLLRGVENVGAVFTSPLGASLHTNVSDSASATSLSANYADTDVLAFFGALGTSVNTEINAPNAAMTSYVPVIAEAQVTGTNRWAIHVALGAVATAADLTSRMFPVGTNATPTHFTVGRQVHLIPEPPAVGNGPPVLTVTPTSASLVLGQSTVLNLSVNDPDDDTCVMTLLTDPFNGGIATVIDSGNNTGALSLVTNWRNHLQAGGPSNVVIRTDDGQGHVVDTNVPVTITDSHGVMMKGGQRRILSMPKGIGVPN